MLVFTWQPAIIPSGMHAYHKQPNFRHDDFFKDNFAAYKKKFEI